MKLYASRSEPKLLGRSSDHQSLTCAGSLLLGGANSRPSSSGSVSSTTCSRKSELSTEKLRTLSRGASSSSAVSAFSASSRPSSRYWRECPPPYGCGVGKLAEHRPGCHCQRRCNHVNSFFVGDDSETSKCDDSKIDEITGPPECDVQVKVECKVKPSFKRGPRNTFIMELPTIPVKISTVATNAAVYELGDAVFEPVKEVEVALPAAERVVFDPKNWKPAKMCMSTYVQKRVTFFEISSQKLLDTKIQSDTTGGGVILGKVQLEDGGTSSFEQALLGYRLKALGRLRLDQFGGWGHESHRVYIDFDLEFKSWLADPVFDAASSRSGMSSQQGQRTISDPSSTATTFLTGGFDIRSTQDAKSWPALAKLETRLSEISRTTWRASMEELKQFKFQLTEIETHAWQLERDEKVSLTKDVTQRLQALHCGIHQVLTAVEFKSHAPKWQVAFREDAHDRFR